MGTGGSKASREKILWAMPSWCMEDYVVTTRTVELAHDSWRYCMSGDSPPYIEACRKESNLTPLVFFYNQFYYFLFELLPEVKPLFKKGMQAQGRMLANVVKYIILNLQDKNALTFKSSLQHLARTHNQKNITPEHYSVMGMCLVHTVRLCCGEVYFTEEHKDAWVQIYSKMMSVIIPVVVAGELPGLDDGDSVYLKAANNHAINADADRVHKSKLQPKDVAPTKKCPASGATGGTCPASGATAGDEPEISRTLQTHFSTTAAAHAAAAQAEATHNQMADAALSKYKALKRVLGVAQQVEIQVREKNPQGIISGKKLIRMLLKSNLVPDHDSAVNTCKHFVRLHLISSQTKQAKAAEQAEEKEGEEVKVERQWPPNSPAPCEHEDTFHPDETQYQFMLLEEEELAPVADRAASLPPPQHQANPEFAPRCYVRPPIAAIGRVQHVLDSSKSNSGSGGKVADAVQTPSLSADGVQHHTHEPSQLETLKTVSE